MKKDLRKEGEKNWKKEKSKIKEKKEWLESNR